MACDVGERYDRLRPVQEIRLTPARVVTAQFEYARFNDRGHLIR